MSPGFAISSDFPLLYYGQCPLPEVIWTQSSFVGRILKWAEIGSTEPHPHVCLLDPHMHKPTFLTQLRWQQTKSRIFSHWDLHGVSPAPAHTSSHSSREAALTGLAFTAERAAMAVPASFAMRPGTAISGSSGAGYSPAAPWHTEALPSGFVSHRCFAVSSSFLGAIKGICSNRQSFE